MLPAASRGPPSARAEVDAAPRVTRPRKQRRHGRKKQPQKRVPRLVEHLSKAFHVDVRVTDVGHSHRCHCLSIASVCLPWWQGQAVHRTRSFCARHAQGVAWATRAGLQVFEP